MIHFDQHIFQMGWFNHQLVVYLQCEGIWKWSTCSDELNRSSLGEIRQQGNGVA